MRENEIPLTQLLDQPHSRPTPGATLDKLRVANSSAASTLLADVHDCEECMDQYIRNLEATVERIKKDIQRWKDVAMVSRSQLAAAGVSYGADWN